MSEDLTGRKLGAYQIIEMIGMGGMATVYKAVQPNMERDVAIKVLPRALAHDPTFVGRFKQEAKVIARLEHSRILPVYDYGEEDGIIYLVMRYLNAGTLSERIEQGTIPLDEVARIITQIAEGLDHAHKRGVFHRDIKPSNILLDESGDAYITDFGIARIAEGTAQFTGSGIVGTPTYISPEQAMGNPVDGRTDVYSLGVVLYQMITGDVPYQAETPMGVLIKHINDPLPVPRSVKPDIPANVEAVLLRSLAKNPDARYQTAGDMARDLREAAANPSAPSTAAAAVGGLVGAYAAQDTMPMSAPDIEATAQSSPTGVLPPPSPADPQTPTAKQRPRWMIPLAGFAALICVCLCVLLAIRTARDGDSDVVEATLDEIIGQPTEPPIVAEVTDASGVAAEPTLESESGGPTCSPNFDTVADFDFSEIPAGLEVVGNTSIQTTDDGDSVLVMQAEGEDASYMVIEPLVGDVSITMAFLMPSGAADIGLIVRANENDTGYSGVILNDGTALISRNNEAVASGTPPNDVFDGAPHGMTLRSSGSIITLFIDGVQVASYDDPDPLPAGFLGFGAGSGEVWINGLLACSPFLDGASSDEPFFLETFDTALDERWGWINEPGEGHWALEDGRLRIDVLPATGYGSGITPIVSLGVPEGLDIYTIDVTLHIESVSNQAGGIGLFSRNGDPLASLVYGVRPSSEGDVEAVFFDDWVAYDLDRESYRSHIAGAGFLVDDVILRLVIAPAAIHAGYSYDGGVTWESAGTWAALVARIARVGLLTVGGADIETIPVYFDDFTVYDSALIPEN